MILLQQDFFVFSQMSTFNNLLKMHKNENDNRCLIGKML